MPTMNELQQQISCERKRRDETIEIVDKQLETEIAVSNGKCVDIWSSIRQQSFMQLLNALRNDELRPVDVLHAYQYAAIRAHHQINCIVEIVVDAEMNALALEDKYRNNNHKPALYGMSISIKGSIALHGTKYTSGFVFQSICEPSTDDAIVVAALVEQGAIPFVHTNVPQSLLIHSCENPVYGTTVHPIDANRSPGGSSGGEGALIGSGASPLGIGTDGAGSVRIPSSWNGIVGIKPTAVRTSQLGAVPLDGTKNLGISWGPMSNEVCALIEVLRVVFNSPIVNQLDPYISPKPFCEQLLNSTKPLTIGWYDFDGFIRPLPVMQRVVHETRDALAARGHTLVEWRLPRVIDAMRYLAIMFFPDGGQKLVQDLNRDIADPSITDYFRIFRTPIWCRQLIATILNFIPGEYFSRMATILGFSITSSYQLRNTFANMDQYKYEIVKSWNDQQLDAVICPSFAYPAPPLTLPPKTSLTGIVTGLYNVVDFPAGVVPVSRLNATDQANIDAWTPIDYYDRLIAKAFNGDRSNIGLPIAVQCVALPNKDEMCLRLMREIEQIFTRTESN